jgi:hypothetical protein
VRSDAWRFFAPWLGEQEGAGIGLMAVVAGLLVVIFTVAAYLRPEVRHIEAILPDYVAVPGESTEAAKLDERSSVPEGVA